MDYVGYVDTKLTMVRPVNGTRYDSYIYSQYFDVTIDGANAPDKITLAAIRAIKQIPQRVTYEQRALVEKARALYDKIATMEQKALVTNYPDLISAEQRIISLTPTDEPVEIPEETPEQKGNGGLIAVIVLLCVLFAAVAAAAVYVVVKAKKENRPVKEVTVEFLQTVKAVSLRIWAFVVPWAKKIWAVIVMVALKVWPVIEKLIKRVWPVVLRFANKVWPAIEKCAKPAAAFVTKCAVAFAGWCVKALGTVAAFAKKLFTKKQKEETAQEEQPEAETQTEEPKKQKRVRKPRKAIQIDPKVKKIVLIVVASLAAAALIAGIVWTVANMEPAQPEDPYAANDAQNYSVSVMFDANGGFFTTNTSVIVDSFNMENLPQIGGKAQVALIAPDDAARDKNAFTAINNGYFLAGWYTERIENGTDAAGNPAYTYSGKWDFKKDKLELDPAGEYTAKEPVLTLYAAWIPMFQFEFYELSSGELMETLAYDPTSGKELALPAWNEETGAIEMYNFPAKSGYTFNGVYYDAEGIDVVLTETIAHTGTVDYTNGTGKDATMKLYVDWQEGEWFRIYNADQFVKNASVAGHYEIFADIDFSGKNWPTSLMHGSFTGTIHGNGYTFRNISFKQTNKSKVNSGLFGQIAETAVISDLTFENVTFTIEGGTRVAGASYGLLAGSITSEAQLVFVTITSGTVQIDSDCYFGTDDYTIGLVCGMGTTDIDYSGITCTAVGDKPESVIITVNGSTVTVEFAEG